MQADPPSYSIILLAAGSSSRMGSPKQLLAFQGQPMLARAVETALAARCGPVTVVLGANEPQLRTLLAGFDVQIIINPRWQQGLGTSIQAGLTHIETQNTHGVILMLADQPFVTQAHLRALISAHQQSAKPIIASQYAQTVGVPAFFAPSYYPYLNALKPDQGCKGVIQTHAHDALLLDCPQAAIDIDTPQQYARHQAAT